MKKAALFGGLLFLLLAAITSNAYECGSAPPTSQPQRIKAGEGFPPLPLPVTPLRRTERKNPPAPPVLVGKVICGPNEQWTRADNDVENLLKITSGQLGIPYGAIKIDLNNFSFDPEELPILYITSVEPLLPPARFNFKIREYLEKGGFLWVNASSGSPDFTRSVVEWLAGLYPDKNLYPVYADHPLAGCVNNLQTVRFLKDNQPGSTALNLRVMNLGCRAAIILSPYDLGCGWAMHTHAWGSRYAPEDAVKIGSNMVGYCLAWIEFARMQGFVPLYAEKTRKKEGKLYVGQVMHGGDWDPHPAGLGKMLKAVSEKTSASVYLERLSVDLKTENLANVPLLYLTGHFNPGFAPEEKEKLRKFLLSGGALIADSCCGSQAFTDGFRELMKQVLPEAKAIKLPAGHPVYRLPFRIEQFQYDFSHDDTPPLEAYQVNGLPAVIFCPYGLGSGWEGIPRPYTRGIAPGQAQQLGVNIVTYLVTN